MIKTEKKQPSPVNHDEPESRSLSDNVQLAIEHYFQDLDGHDVNDLHAFFLEQVEKPFFDVVMKHTHGNITHAADILGLNRATLRKRLKKYNLD